VTREVGEAPGADPQMQTPEPEAAGQAPGGPDGTWDDPRIPWSGRPRPVDILCWAGIVLSGIYYWALLPFVAPLVGTHPVLLEVLNGNTAAIISAAAFVRIGHGSLVVVLLAALPGLMKFDILYWWAGRLWGERIIALLSGRRNRGGRYMARVQRWGRKFTWPAVLVAQFLPIPTAIIYVVVGWAGMRLVTFLILDAIGTLAWAGLLAGLGYELGHHAVVVAQTISHYGLWISIALIVVIVFFQVRSQRHMLRVARQGRPAATGGQASTAATGGQASTAAAGGQANAAATGGQASMVAQARGGDEAGN
jgi:membrane-associated protein